MAIEGNQQMDLDNEDDEHETENDGAEATDEDETTVGTALGSGCRSWRRAMVLCLH
jgi:hypothetical protein